MNELLASLNAAEVRYLVIGGQAIRLAGMPRFSIDGDFFIPPRDLENFTRLNAAVVRNAEDGFEVKCLSGRHLLASKQAADRPEDQPDIAFLLELQKLGKLD